MLQLVHNTDGIDSVIDCMEFIEHHKFEPHYLVADTFVKDNRIFAVRSTHERNKHRHRVLVDKSLLTISPY